MSEWRVVENGDHAVILDEAGRSIVRVVNGTPCFDVETAHLICNLRKRAYYAEGVADLAIKQRDVAEERLSAIDRQERTAQ